MATAVEELQAQPGFDQLAPEKQEALLRKVAGKMPAPAPVLPPPPPPPSWKQTAREVVAGPLRLGTGAASAVLGLPADVLTLSQYLYPGAVAAQFSGDPSKQKEVVTVPGGSADWERWLTTLQQAAGLYAPPPKGSWAETGEQLATTLGRFAGPGVILRGLQSLGVVPQVIEKTLPYVSAGAGRDVLLGTTAAVGEQVAGPAGAVIAPLTVAAGHGAVDAALRAIGRRVLPRQAVKAATQEVYEAEPAVRRAQQELAKTPVTAETTLRTGVPAGDADIAGRAARTTTGEAVTAAAATLGQRYQDEVQAVAPYLNRLQALDTTATGFRRVFRDWRSEKNRLFKATEAVTGNEPVLTLERLHAAGGKMLRETELTGQYPPRGTGVMQRLGRDAADPEGSDMLQLLQSPRLEGVRDPERQQVIARLVDEWKAGHSETPVPFWLARRLESILGEAAWRNAKPIGTLSQGRARQMWYGLQDDMRTFFTEHAAGQQVQQGLRQAKDLYIDGINVYNNSIVKHLLSRVPKEREQFLDKFVVSGNLTELAEIKTHASPEVWNQLVAHTMADIAERASVNGVIVPQRLAGQARRLETHGKIDLLLTPEQKAQFRATVQEMQAVKGAPSTRLAQRLATMEPGDIPGHVFQAGQVERTRQFRSMTPPDVYDQTVQAWATGFADELGSLSPDQAIKRLRGLSRGRPSQLDVMLDQYPGVADQLTDLVQRYDATRRNLGTAQATLAGTQQQLRDARMRAGLAPDEPLPTVRSRMHVGNMIIHGSPWLGGIASVLAGILTNHPYVGMTGGAIAAGTIAGQYLARSAAGQRAMAEGLAHAYGPAAQRFAGQILAQETSREETPPTPAATPLTTSALVVSPPVVRAAMEQAAQQLQLTSKPTDVAEVARYRQATAAILQQQGYDAQQIQQMLGGQ